MLPTVHNGDADHRPLGIVLPSQGLVTEPIATRGCPFLATDVCASDSLTETFAISPVCQKYNETLEFCISTVPVPDRLVLDKPEL